MSESKQDFTELKRLLKLKQHEIPPPGYFHHFSGDVIARIRSGETGYSQGWLERLHLDIPIITRFVQLLEAKPGTIGAFATSVCLLLLVGVLVADHADTDADSANGSDNGNLASGDPSSSAGLGANATLASTVGLSPADNSGIAISTNPVTSLQPVASAFNSQQNPLFQPVGFAPAGH